MNKEVRLNLNSEKVRVIVNCRVCGKDHAILVHKDGYKELMSPNRRHIQEIFPYLDADERELLISQVCPECWKKVFGEEIQC